MNAVLINDFKSAGALNDIYAAMDTYDMGLVIRATLNALYKINELPHSLHSGKYRDVSIVSRNVGNENYKIGNYRQAVQFYNKALAFAPKSSNELILAHSNRSAVFFKIRYFTACIIDINICLAMDCSESLANKLRRRRDDAARFVFEQDFIQMITSTEFVTTFLRFECVRNSDVPCASADVSFVSREGIKKAAARRDIKPGTLVAVEKSFVNSAVKNNNCEYLACYFCSRSDLCLFPCDGCCEALFCNDTCRELCMKAYHSIECQIIENLGKLYNNVIVKLTTKAAIKMSLKMTWDDLVAASKDIGVSRMRTATVKQTFSVDDPISMLSYVDDEQLLEGRMFNGSIFISFIVHHLNMVPNYFPKELAKRGAALEAIGRIMLNNYVTFNNKILIQNSAYDFNNKVFRSNIQTSFGWFSMCSKLKHSCEPNLMVVGLNDSVALLALRTIKRGEELTITYGEHFYNTIIPETNDPMIKVIDLFLNTRQMCGCRVCMQKWDQNSSIMVEMTKKQSKLFEKLNEKEKSMSYECFYGICAALDAFPINSVQHKTAYDSVRQMMNPLQSKWYNSFTYI